MSEQMPGAGPPGRTVSARTSEGAALDRARAIAEVGRCQGVIHNTLITLALVAGSGPLVLHWAPWLHREVTWLGVLSVIWIVWVLWVLEQLHTGYARRSAAEAQYAKMDRAYDSLRKIQTARASASGSPSQ